MSKRWIGAVSGVVASLVLALGAQGASAATISATCSTLQSDLNSANPGDVIQLTGICANDSFTLTNTNAFTLEGVGNVANGTPSSGFNGSASTTESIIGSNDAVQLTIKNLLFENANYTSGDGGAIDFTADDLAVTIEGNTFLNDSSGDVGGAINIESEADGAGTTTPTLITNNAFVGDSSGDGGAVYWEDGSPLEVTDNTFTGNSATGAGSYYPAGGALDVENYEGPPWLGDPVTISGNTFGGTGAGQGNKAPAWGGAVFISVQGGEGSNEPGQTVTLSTNKFIDNQVTSDASYDLVGGALAFSPQIREYGFRVLQAHNLFEGNSVTGSVSSGYGAGGGGEWATAMTVSSVGDVFSGNQVNVTGEANPAPEGGGLGILGIEQAIGGGSTVAVPASFTGEDDVFQGNSVPESGAWGGAIYTGGTTNPICHGTSACAPSHLTLDDSTLVGNSVNSSSGEGAGIWGSPGDSLALDNSIVFGNTGAAGASEVFGYTSPSYQYSDLCQTAGGSTAATGAGNICENPSLNASAEETSSSPTIDKGSNALVPAGLTTDVAGNPRITVGLAANCPNAIVDMGAFESAGVTCGHPPSCHIGKLKTKKHKPAARTVTVGCNAAATGKLALVVKVVSGKGKHRKRKTIRLKGRALTLAANKSLKVKLKLPGKVLAAIRAGKECTLVLTLTATDSGGTGKTSKKFKLRL